MEDKITHVYLSQWSAVKVVDSLYDGSSSWLTPEFMSLLLSVSSSSDPFSSKPGCLKLEVDSGVTLWVFRLVTFRVAYNLKFHEVYNPPSGVFLDCQGHY